MKSKVRPEECCHVFCKSCITAWTTTFSNVCPLCKVEIKLLLIYKEKLGPEDEGFEESMQSEEDIVVEKIVVTKPVVNDEISDWVQSFAENCYEC